MTAGLLRGEHVVLRLVEPGDAEALTTILAEPEVARWWPAMDAARVRADLVGRPEQVFAIVVGDEVAGAIQFGEEDDAEYRSANIDLFVAPAHRGRGLGPDALRVLARHLFAARGHHRITIDPTVGNAAAIRAYEKVGFRPVGVMREYVRHPVEGLEDGLLMDLLARELR